MVPARQRKPCHFLTSYWERKSNKNKCSEQIIF